MLTGVVLPGLALALIVIGAGAYYTLRKRPPPPERDPQGRFLAAFSLRRRKKEPMP